MNEAAGKLIDRWGLVAVLLIAFVLRVAAISVRSGELTHDRDAYLGIARGVAVGRGLCSPDSDVPTAFRPPLYPVLLGVLMKVTDAATSVALINVAFGLLAVATTRAVGRRLGLERRADFAALLVAIDPLLLQYSTQPMTESICTGLVGLLLFFWTAPVAESSGSSSRSEFVTGLVFGLLVLCRPTFWPLAGLMALAWCCRARTHVAWRVVLGTLLVVAPWVIRNQLIFGQPLLTTTHGGYTLLLANNNSFYTEVVDQPWGTVWQDASLRKWQDDLDSQLARDLKPNASELERDHRMSLYAREYIANNPVRFIKAVWHRFRSLWNTTPQGEAANASTILLSVVGMYYVLTLFGFAVGLVRVAMGPNRSRWIEAFMLLLTVQAVHLVYWTNTRMRAPVVPVLSLFVAAALSPVGRKVFPMRTPSLGRPIGSAGMTGNTSESSRKQAENA